MKKICILCLTIILLFSITACGDKNTSTTAELTPIEKIENTKKMIFIDGELYVDTGKESSFNRLCGTPDGTITTTVEENNIPTQENQSNFGVGYGYQRTCDCEIDVLIDNKWQVFQSNSEQKNTSLLAPQTEQEDDSCCSFDPNAPIVSDCDNKILN